MEKNTGAASAGDQVSARGRSDGCLGTTPVVQQTAGLAGHRRSGDDALRQRQSSTTEYKIEKQAMARKKIESPDVLAMAPKLALAASPYAISRPARTRTWDQGIMSPLL